MRKVTTTIILSILLSVSIYGQNEWAQIMTKDSTGNYLRGVIDNKGNVIIPTKFKYIWLDDSIFHCENENNKLGFLSIKGDTLIPLEYNSLNFDNESRLYLAKKDYEWLYIDSLGKKMFGPYEFACHFKKGKAYVLNDDEGYFINLSGEKIETTLFTDKNCPKGSGVEDEEEFVELDYSEKLVIIPQGFKIKKNKQGKVGVKSKKGDFIIPLIFDAIDFENNKYIYVKKDGLQGVFDFKGKEIIPCKYHFIGSFTAF